MNWSLLATNLRRNPFRNGLTTLSVAIAFILFMLLRAISDAFSGGASLEGTNRLVVDAKYSMTDNLPYRYLAQILTLEGVANVANVSWFGGYYKDPQETFTTFPVTPGNFFDVFREYTVAPEVMDRFSKTRSGAVASEALAEQYNWSVGDRITLQGDIWPKENGSWAWDFVFVGTMSHGEDQHSEPLFLLQYEYFNESVADWAKNQVGFIAVRLEDDANPDSVSAKIDALFQNSSDPTRTADEDQYTRQFANQLGDIGLIATSILAAVFFTILLLTSNTASQTFRERIPELAVLKTLGFTDASVARLVLTEAVVICLAGGAIGIIVAMSLEPTLNANLKGYLGGFKMTRESGFLGILIAAVMGLVIGAPSALAARRLSIVEALRK